MGISKQRIFDLLFVILVLVFVMLKISDIATPYFWDEIGVYAPGALKMKDNGTFGLLPSCLEPLYSRGHPLLFVFVQAVWFGFFGDEVISGHACSIFIATATLITFYFFVKDLFGKKIAFFAALLLTFQPVFFAMSGVILPEMMLTLFTIPAVWCVIRKRWGLFAVFGSMAMMTKESAIVLPVLALLFAIADDVAARRFSISSVRRILWALTPVLIYAIFLVIQKKQNGWYFFPEHMGYVERNLFAFEQIWYILLDAVVKQGKAILLIGILHSLFFTWRGGYSPVQKRAISISLIFVVGCIGFAYLNFYLFRYLLYAIPFVVLTAVAGLFALADRLPLKWRNSILYLCMAASLALGVLYMDKGEFNDTADMSYKRLVKAQLQTIDWVKQQPWKDSLIEANFPLYQAMEEPRNGYLSGKALNTSVNFKQPTRYGVFFHFKKEERFVWNDRPYTTIKEFTLSYGFISIVKF